MTYDFFVNLAKAINCNKSRSIVLGGNIHDLFYDGKDFVPIIEFLNTKYATPSAGRITQIVYEVNRPVQIIGPRVELFEAWKKVKGSDDIESLLSQTADNPTFAIEFIRQLTVCGREANLSHSLIIIIESADILLPLGNISGLSFADRKRIAIFQDWFGDPKFLNGQDTVILLCESKSLIHPSVGTLPQIISINIPSPNEQMRRLFSNHILGKELFVAETAGLNLHAYRQLLKQPDITTKDVTHQIEEYVQGQLGDDVVEFKQPEHNLDDVIGFSQIKELIRNEIIPRANGPVDEALAGMVVCGPIGSGKTFIMEAMAAEIGMPVLILKNLRSQWFGQTDVIFERLKRTLEALGKVCILVDEADTVFGSVEQEQHSTEKRLTGKVQGMMSDPKFKGKILWILITARVHLLPPDIRRPGRAGDLIIPVLDPYDKDRQDFVNWTLRGMTLTFDAYPVVFENTKHFTTVDFSLLRTSIKIRKPQHREDLISIIEDIIPSDIDGTRKTQIFQALLNCTRKSLIPKNYIVGDINESRKKWKYNLINLLQK